MFLGWFQGESRDFEGDLMVNDDMIVTWTVILTYGNDDLMSLIGYTWIYY